MRKWLPIILGLATPVLAQDAPLPVADLQRDTPVDFAKEIVPFLKKNCFACHNEKKAKADLNLESPQAMIAGGDSGPSLVPGKPTESLIFTYAAHLEDDPMPPPKNKAKAVNLTAAELALLKLWIAQGGKGGSAAVLAGPSEWSGLESVNSIYATAISDDGRFVAAGRGNRIHLYDLWRGAFAGDLVDPDLGNGAAHRDSVHALTFNRHGVLASGGFRSAILWKRSADNPLRLGKGLPEAPTALAASPNGEWVAAGDAKGNLVLQPLNGKAPITPGGKHETAVRSLVFTADSAHFYSLSDDKVLRRTNVADPKVSKALDWLPTSTSLALLENGQKLALGGADGVIRIIPAAAFDQPPEADSPAPVATTGHNSRVNVLLAFTPDGNQFLSASEDGTARLWDLAGKEIRQFNHGSPIAALAAHAGAGRIATAGADGIVRVWNAADGKKLADLSGDHEFEFRKASATRRRDVAKAVAEMRRKQVEERDKNWKAAGEKSKKASDAFNAAVKDLAAKDAAAHKLRRPAEHANDEVAAIQKAEDKSQIGAANERAKKANEALQKAEGELANAERKHTGAKRNRELAVRDGTRAAETLLAAQSAAAEADGHLAASEESLKKLEEEAKSIGPGAVRDLAFALDGSTLAAATEKMGVRRWSTTTLKPLDVLQRGRDTSALAVLPDGGFVTAFADKSLARFAPPSWSKSKQIGDGSNAELFPGRVLALAFHPRGHLLATGSGTPSRSGELKIWKVRDASLHAAIEKPHADTITGLAFSPDGSQIASSSTDRLIKVHRIDTGELIHKLEGHTNHVLDVAWSADGQTIASAGADKLTKLWTADVGKQKKSEGGFKKEVTSIEFLGAGESVLTADGAKTVKAAGQVLGGIDGFVYAVDATPDGATIVAGGEDGILRVWNASDRKLLHSFAPPKKEGTETAAR